MSEPREQARLDHHVVPALTEVPHELRMAMLAGPRDPATHGIWLDELPALRQIEAGGAAPVRERCDGPLRVVAWNVERLGHPEPIARTLTRLRADVSLLTEVDRGMARTGNTDRIAQLAERLGEGWLFAVEFVELGLGDLDEQRRHAGEPNLRGFHGAALTSDLRLHRPFLVRIEERGDWFDGTRHEPRVGGRIALGAQVEVGGTSVTLVGVHLESHGGPAERAADMRRLLDAVDRYDRHAPVLLGGDFNTSTGSLDERHGDPRAWQAALAREPERRFRPQAWEPMFELLAERGYDWTACNVADAPTTRSDGDDRPEMKIDWMFTRGLAATAPQVVPAVDAHGSAISDHEALVVEVLPLSRVR